MFTDRTSRAEIGKNSCDEREGGDELVLFFLKMCDLEVLEWGYQQ